MNCTFESYINVLRGIGVVWIVLVRRLILTIKVVGKWALVSVESLENFEAVSLVDIASGKVFGSRTLPSPLANRLKTFTSIFVVDGSVFRSAQHFISFTQGVEGSHGAGEILFISEWVVLDRESSESIADFFVRRSLA